MIYNLINKKISILFLFALIFTMVGFFGSTVNTVEAAGTCLKASADCAAIKQTDPLCDPSCSAAECARLNSRLTSCGLDPNSVGAPKSLALIVGDLLRGLFGLLGTVFLVLVIYGGFLWMTAGGNEESISKAKKIITQAAIGLLVIVIAYALTDFIFNTIITATDTTA